MVNGPSPLNGGLPCSLGLDHRQFTEQVPQAVHSFCFLLLQHVGMAMRYLTLTGVDCGATAAVQAQALSFCSTFSSFYMPHEIFLSRHELLCAHIRGLRKGLQIFQATNSRYRYRLSYS